MCYNTYFAVVYCAATFFENVSNRSRAGAGGRGRDTIAVWHSAVRSCGLSIIAKTIVTMFVYLGSVDVRTTIIIFRYDENPKSWTRQTAFPKTAPFDISTIVRRYIVYLDCFDFWTSNTTKKQTILLCLSYDVSIRVLWVEKNHSSFITAMNYSTIRAATAPAPL